MTAEPGPPVRRRALTGADLFTRVLDVEARRGGLPGFQAMILLELAARPDTGRLRAALEGGTRAAELARARLVRTWPLLRPAWDLARPGAVPEVRETDEAPAGAAPWPVLLEEPLRPARGENLRFVVFPAAAGRWIAAFVYHHVAFDARAAERFVAGLSPDATDDSGRAAAAGGAHAADAARSPGLAESLRLAKAQNTVIEAAAGGRIHRFATEADGPVEGVGACVAALGASDTSRAVAAGRSAAGYGMEGLWALATFLAADRETDPRPRGAGRVLVPLPVSLDRVGERGRAFGNHLAFSFLSAAHDEAGDPVRTARAFRAQLLSDLRDEGLRRCTAQLTVCGPIPAPVYSFLARGTTGGAFGSVFFSNPGPVDPRLATFLGVPVVSVSHLPAPLPVPGVCATVWSFGGSWSLGLTWVRGRVAEARARALLARWRTLLAGTEAAP